MSELRERIIRAHGGRRRLASTARVLACASMGGTAFVSHLQPRPLRAVDITLEPRSMAMSLSPFPRLDRTGYFVDGRVWIADGDGHVVAQRAEPARVIGTAAHWLLWDELDLLYVVGATLAQAVLFPWLLCREDVTDIGMGSVEAADGRLHRLAACLPATLAAASPTQTFHADNTGLVRRIDLAPITPGNWLRVGQTLADFEAVSGIVLPTRHTLYPCLGNNRLWPGTRLIWLRLDDISVECGAATGIPRFAAASR